MAIDYSQRIPNNVDLSNDRRLQRALENWQPRFLDWWKDMGPDGTTNFDVYLRTAISAEAKRGTGREVKRSPGGASDGVDSTPNETPFCNVNTGG